MRRLKLTELRKEIPKRRLRTLKKALEQSKKLLIMRAT